MTLLYLVIIVCAIGYIAYISQRYSTYVQTTKPHIEDLLGQNDDLLGEISSEKESIRNTVEQIKVIEIEVKDVKVGVQQVEEQIAQEKANQEKLELAQQMKQFNKKKG